MTQLFGCWFNLFKDFCLFLSFFILVSLVKVSTVYCVFVYSFVVVLFCIIISFNPNHFVLSVLLQVICPNKQSVFVSHTGRTCSECRDEFFNLEVSQSQGCLPCSCHAVGSISNLCNKTTGQCPCENGLRTDNKCVSAFCIYTYGPSVCTNHKCVSAFCIYIYIYGPSVNIWLVVFFLMWERTEFMFYIALWLWYKKPH